MANGFYKCRPCGGNMWPDSSSGRNHVHLTKDELRRRLKKKHLMPKTGWSKAANPRSNAPKASVKSVVPRKRAYGPF